MIRTPLRAVLAYSEAQLGEVSDTSLEVPGFAQFSTRGTNSAEASNEEPFLVIVPNVGASIRFFGTAGTVIAFDENPQPTILGTEFASIKLAVHCLTSDTSDRGYAHLYLVRLCPLSEVLCSSRAHLFVLIITLDSSIERKDIEATRGCSLRYACWPLLYFIPRHR